MHEKIVEERRETGFDLIHLHGAPGYHTEHIMISRGSSNGLRIEISDDGDDSGNPDSDGWWCFHIDSPETARLLATKLLEFSERQFNLKATNDSEDEPTEEMILAGAKAAVDQIYLKGGFWDRHPMDESEKDCWLKAMRWGWKAMQAAAHPRS